MSTHQFVVTVEVQDWSDEAVAESPYPGRTEEDYALAALYAVGLRDAERLDGYADLGATVEIVDVEAL